MAKIPRENQQPLGAVLVGRTFVHPLYDYILIGGLLSLAVVAVVLLNPKGGLFISAATLPYFVLLSNSAHFAASTVRLYTKPDAIASLPFLTMVVPLLALVLLTMCIFQADTVGSHLMSLYLTWSPYHYAAQAYGLAVIYCHRSGCSLSAGNKKLLYWVAVLPFIYIFVTAGNVGLHWIDVFGWLETPSVMTALRWFTRLMPVVAFAAIFYLIGRIWRSAGQPMPLISILVLISNGIWWFILPPLHAFVWATIFHGVQYLAIVILFHLKDQTSRPSNRHGKLYHVCWFYGACLVLGYALFNVLPQAYIYAGFNPVESVVLVVGVINIHHFIVDAYIWRLNRSDSNRKIVDSGTIEPA